VAIRALLELDKAISIAFRQAAAKSTEARKRARDRLAARRACGANRMCILEEQVQTIEWFSLLGSDVPVPSWVGEHRIALFKASGKRPTAALPQRVLQCTMSKISRISTRFGEPLKPPTEPADSSGSAVEYANGGYQVSYSFVEAIAESRIGDDTLICLLSIPKDCPPGDDRGRFYSATNLRTKGSWVLPDAQHMCGGA
jgi:hypothetical protein